MGGLEGKVRSVEGGCGVDIHSEKGKVEVWGRGTDNGAW